MGDDPYAVKGAIVLPAVMVAALVYGALNAHISLFVLGVHKITSFNLRLILSLPNREKICA